MKPGKVIFVILPASERMMCHDMHTRAEDPSIAQYQCCIVCGQQSFDRSLTLITMLRERGTGAARKDRRLKCQHILCLCDQSPPIRNFMV